MGPSVVLHTLVVQSSTPRAAAVTAGKHACNKWRWALPFASVNGDLGWPRTLVRTDGTAAVHRSSVKLRTAMHMRVRDYCLHCTCTHKAGSVVQGSKTSRASIPYPMPNCPKTSRASEKVHRCSPRLVHPVAAAIHLRRAAAASDPPPLAAITPTILDFWFHPTHRLSCQPSARRRRSIISRTCSFNQAPPPPSP